MLKAIMIGFLLGLLGVGLGHASGRQPDSGRLARVASPLVLALVRAIPTLEGPDPCRQGRPLM